MLLRCRTLRARRTRGHQEGARGGAGELSAPAASATSRLLELIAASATRRNVVASHVAAAITGLLVWWAGGGDSIRASLGGAPMLELRWRWTPAEALALLEPLAYAERVRYLRFQYLDLVFPIVYAAALSLGIAFQLGAAAQPGRWKRWLALLPVGVLAADWWENVNLVAAIPALDERPVAALARAAAGTTAKWAAFCATVLVYAAAFAWRGLQREAR